MTIIKLIKFIKTHLVVARFIIAIPLIWLKMPLFIDLFCININ
jgi:hypothetical protein